MSTANDYHNATKYDPDTIRNGPGVDWSAQPSPYKDFHSKTRINLGPHLLLAREADTDRPLLMDADPTADDYELSRLSTFLLHINGVTAQQPTPGGSVFFRAAPSAGALYPTELYVAVRDIDGIDDGLYNYQTRDHSLAPVLEGNFLPEIEAFTDGHAAIASSRVVILFSVVFYRSSWRYHDRAYRRILLDSGHVLGNLFAFAPDLDYSPVAISGFNDAAVNDMLFFNTEEEAALLLVALPEEACTAGALGKSSAPDPIAGDLIQQAHQAGAISAPGWQTSDPLPFEEIPASNAQQTFALTRKSIDWGRELGPTILLRRSTRGFTGGPITTEQLGMILGYAYRGGATEDLLDPARLLTFLSIHRVEGLDPGLYRFDPATSRLLLLRRGYNAREDHQIGLGQELMRDAAVVIYHFADIESAVASCGDRSYRYLNLDAGHIGERINLAALRLGVGVSGIGGYFDDQANALFHRPSNEGVVYITCLGSP